MKKKLTDFTSISERDRVIYSCSSICVGDIKTFCCLDCIINFGHAASEVPFCICAFGNNCNDAELENAFLFSNSSGGPTINQLLLVLMFIKNTINE